MDEENIKYAFDKVKQDIWYLNQEISVLGENLLEISGKIEKMGHLLETNISTHNAQKQTIPTNLSTHNSTFNSLKQQNMPISTGNGGVSTDRQTDRHIDNHPLISTAKPEIYPKKQEILDFDQAAEILDSLDNIKKEIRLKFKKLTEQEMSIFSTIYQLEEEKGYADYKSLSELLNITESSTRDHVGRIIKKGVPVEKKRVNNKKIHLFISQNLKKITSLSTILQLRGI
jgi:DNA-binding MarR family transcriptional regulator